jgi:hypothetical protein
MGVLVSRVAAYREPNHGYIDFRAISTLHTHMYFLDSVGLMAGPPWFPGISPN